MERQLSDEDETFRDAILELRDRLLMADHRRSKSNLEWPLPTVLQPSN